MYFGATKRGTRLNDMVMVVSADDSDATVVTKSSSSSSSSSSSPPPPPSSLSTPSSRLDVVVAAAGEGGDTGSAASVATSDVHRQINRRASGGGAAHSTVSYENQQQQLKVEEQQQRTDDKMSGTVYGEHLKPVYRDGDVVLDVECGRNQGLLYLSRLCQGSKGPCILFKGMWLTPNEFQYVSGRETAKDWKRSIRHHGKSMKLLLAKGILAVHPPICDCDGCRISSPVNRGRLAEKRTPTSISAAAAAILFENGHQQYFDNHHHRQYHHEHSRHHTSSFEVEATPRESIIARAPTSASSPLERRSAQVQHPVAILQAMDSSNVNGGGGGKRPVELQTPEAEKKRESSRLTSIIDQLRINKSKSLIKNNINNNNNEEEEEVESKDCTSGDSPTNVVHRESSGGTTCSSSSTQENGATEVAEERRASSERISEESSSSSIVGLDLALRKRRHQQEQHLRNKSQDKRHHRLPSNGDGKANNGCYPHREDVDEEDELEGKERSAKQESSSSTPPPPPHFTSILNNVRPSQEQQQQQHPPVHHRHHRHHHHHRRHHHHHHHHHDPPSDVVVAAPSPSNPSPPNHPPPALPPPPPPPLPAQLIQETQPTRNVLVDYKQRRRVNNDGDDGGGGGEQKYRAVSSSSPVGMPADTLLIATIDPTKIKTERLSPSPSTAVDQQQLLVLQQQQQQQQQHGQHQHLQQQQQQHHHHHHHAHAMHSRLLLHAAAAAAAAAAASSSSSPSSSFAVASTGNSPQQLTPPPAPPASPSPASGSSSSVGASGANAGTATPILKQMEQMMTRNYSDFMRSLAAKYNNSNPSDGYSYSHVNGFMRNFDGRFPFKTATPPLPSSMSLLSGGSNKDDRKAENHSAPPVLGDPLRAGSVVDLSSTQALISMMRSASVHSASQLENYLRGGNGNVGGALKRPLGPLDIACSAAGADPLDLTVHSTGSSHQSGGGGGNSKRSRLGAINNDNLAAYDLGLRLQGGGIGGKPSSFRELFGGSFGKSDSEGSDVSCDAATSSPKSTNSNGRQWTLTPTRTCSPLKNAGSSSSTAASPSTNQQNASTAAQAAAATVSSSRPSTACLSACTAADGESAIDGHQQQQAEAAAVIARWGVQDVCKFVAAIDTCTEYVETFREQSIDGAALPLLTEEHLINNMQMKLGPALKLRSTLAKRIGHCAVCMHCIHCHGGGTGNGSAVTAARGNGTDSS